MGGKVSKLLDDTVTHVLFLGGSMEDLKKATEKRVHLITTEWLENCKKKMTRIPESSVVDEESSDEEKKQRRKKRIHKSCSDDRLVQSDKKNKKKTIDYQARTTRTEKKTEKRKERDYEPNFLEVSKSIDFDKHYIEKEKEELVVEEVRSPFIEKNPNSNEITNNELVNVSLEKEQKINIHKRKREVDTSVEKENKKAKLPENKKKVICVSCCTDDVLSRLGTLAAKCGDKTTDKVTPETTHLVLGGNSRTLKVIVAISLGIHILHSSWVLDSAKEGHWLLEKKYCVDDWFPGARLSQIAHKGSNGKLIFTDVSFFVEDTSFPKKEMCLVIERLGGKHVDAEEAQYCITSNPIYGNRGVSEKWIFDCLSNWRITEINL
uniref:BRCT domain-containing protein n=1 Tax=Arcella intermedia TaxID=1963864 RepID=A0A6B2L770_9EUKA